MSDAGATCFYIRSLFLLLLTATGATSLTVRGNSRQWGISTGVAVPNAYVVP
jgi:hypothetical protein